MSDKRRFARISKLSEEATQENLGDQLSKALKIFSQITDPPIREFSEIPLSNLRFMASGAEIGWRLFTRPIRPNKNFADIEIIQLMGLERALHELSYAFEMVEKSAEEGWGGSSRTRFYLNSIYHYVSALLLIDTSKKTHLGLPMGGTIIRALHPLGIDKILKPVKAVLDRPLSTNFDFGEAILKRRHSYLVHGTFSPEEIEYLVSDTQMRDLDQQKLFRDYSWDLFYQIVLLRLHVLSMLSSIDAQIKDVISRYVSSVSN